jgi:hypothetical protein
MLTKRVKELDTFVQEIVQVEEFLTLEKASKFLKDDYISIEKI